MKTNNNGSATDKALAKPGKQPAVTSNQARSKKVSLDAVIAEKDEVKNAEERLRRKKDSNK